jgi:tRNA-modifying protein YgfZ
MRIASAGEGQKTARGEETMNQTAGYRAALDSAVIFERPDRGKIAVAGTDRRTYLHAMLTNDVQALQAGTGCYAAYLTQQGRMIADMRVLELGDLVLLDLPVSVAPVVLQKLDQFVFTEDVRLGDLTEAFAGFTLAGPRAAGVLAAVLAADAPSLDEATLRAWPEFANARASHSGQTVLVAATRDLGVQAFDLYIERPHAPGLEGALRTAGAAPGSAEDAEVLRVEAGRPAFGVDMDTETIPLEAGIEGRAISFTKGCYPGQEVIVRVVHRGQGRVAKKLVGLRIEGDVLPSRGDAVRAGDREAGKVTSAVRSPRAGGVIALATLHRDVQQPGTAVGVEHDGQLLTAAIVGLPFVAELS